MLWTVLPLTLVLIGVAFTGVYSHEQSMRDLVQERDQALAAVSAAQVQRLLQTGQRHWRRWRPSSLSTTRICADSGSLLAEAGDLDGLFAGCRRPWWTRVAICLPSVSRLLPRGRRTNRLPELARTVMAQQDIAVTPPLTQPWERPCLLLGVPVQDEAGTTYGVLVAPGGAEQPGAGDAC